MDRLTIKRIDPQQPKPFEWIKGDNGEILGCKTYEELTVVEFKNRFPEVVFIDDKRNKDSTDVG